MGVQLKKRTIVRHTDGSVYRVISCKTKKIGQVLAVPQNSPRFLKVSELKCAKCFKNPKKCNRNRKGCSGCKMLLKPGMVVYHKFYSKEINGGGSWKIIK